LEKRKRGNIEKKGGEKTSNREETGFNYPDSDVTRGEGEFWSKSPSNKLKGGRCYQATEEPSKNKRFYGPQNMRKEFSRGRKTSDPPRRNRSALNREGTHLRNNKRENKNAEREVLSLRGGSNGTGLHGEAVGEKAGRKKKEGESRKKWNGISS